MTKSKKIIKFLTDYSHTVYICKEDSFSASHRLYSNALSADENQALFGKCTNANGHGHNYKYKVTLKVNPGKDTGLLLNLGELKKRMRDNVTDLFDHKNLNLDIDIFKTINPTTENLAIVIWKLLEDQVPDGSLYKVSVSSGERNKFTYRGESS